MTKWPWTPSHYADARELADYAEWICWQEGSTSQSELVKQLIRVDDSDYSGGVPEEDATDRAIETAYAEIERRQKTCRGGYPFAIGEQGHVLKSVLDVENSKHLVYHFLLLTTRLDMKRNRSHACIDGTHLFEEFAAEVAREYFGARAESMVFGTAGGANGFEAKVNDLCKRIKEGNGFKSQSGAQPRAKDGKLDVVAWKCFTDGLPGKLIGFGQCKTGTHYKDKLTQLQPDSFCDKWMHTRPAVLPVRMFLIAEALSESGWYDVSRDAGLLFDRCRIVDFCDEIDPEVLEKVKTWTVTAAKAENLPVF